MQAVALALPQFNDVTVNLTITTGTAPNIAALNLTGAEVDVFLKTAPGVSDSDPSTTKLSTTGGQITITNARDGQAQCVIASSLLQSTEAFTFWRCDVVIGGLRNTAMYGDVRVTRM